MKLLELATYVHPNHAGGAERVIAEVCRGLARRGHAVTLLAGRLPDGPDPRELERDTQGRLRVEPFDLEPRDVWRASRAAVRRALADGLGADADVLHLHQTATALPALAAARRLARRRGRPLPRLLSFYAPYHLEFLARHREGRETGRVGLRARLLAAALRRADRRLLRAADGVLALSRFSVEQIARLHPPAAAAARPSTGGVDLARFRPARDAAERAAARARLGLPAAGPLLLSVRRLVPRMGLADLLDAVARLAADGHAAQLVLAGTGPERAPLEARSRHLGLARSVRFAGRVADEDLPCLYRASDLFVLPTRGLEGFGLATAEALASGLPVVATRAGASPELLTDDAFASLVPPEDPPALAAALAGWLSDPARRARAGAAARAWAEAHLGWEHHVAHVEAACRALVEGAP